MKRLNKKIVALPRNYCLNIELPEEASLPALRGLATALQTVSANNKAPVKKFMLQFSNFSNNLSGRAEILKQARVAIPGTFAGNISFGMTLCGSNHSLESLTSEVTKLKKAGMQTMLPLLGARQVPKYTFKNGLALFAHLIGTSKGPHCEYLIPLYLNSESTQKGIQHTLNKRGLLVKNQVKYKYVTAQLYHPEHFARLKKFRNLDVNGHVLAGLFIFGSLEEKKLYDENFHLDPSFESNELNFKSDQIRFLQKTIGVINHEKAVSPILKCMSDNGIKQLIEILPVLPGIF